MHTGDLVLYKIGKRLTMVCRLKQTYYWKCCWCP